MSIQMIDGLIIKNYDEQKPRSVTSAATTTR